MVVTRRAEVMTHAGDRCVQCLERLHQSCCCRAVVIFGCDCTDEDVPGEWQRAIKCNFKRRSARKDFLAFLTCASCKERKEEDDEDGQ